MSVARMTVLGRRAEVPRQVARFRSAPIVFSNESRDGGPGTSDMDAFWGVCVLYVLIRHLMGSAGCRAARLKSQSAKLTACYRIPPVIGSRPRSLPLSGARFDLLLG